MKTELIDVTATQKTLTVEIPSEVVDAEIARVAKDYSKQAKLPGFRPGKVPTSVIKQRFKEQILHDVMHGLIPRAIEEALTERSVEPVDTPNVKDVNLKEGQPLTFSASLETIPPFDPGDLTTVSAHRPAVAISDDAVAQSLEQIRERAAKFETIEGRPVADGDTLDADLARTDPKGETDRHEGITIELGSPANPPGFDANLIGLEPGQAKEFTVHFPADYPVPELAGQELVYHVTVKAIRRKSLPDLDDAFAKDVGDFESLDALRERLRADMTTEAEAHSARHVRSDVLKQLAARLTFELPTAMVEREMDRRLEEFARQLMSQRVDPRQAGIDWAQFRESQRESAREAVGSALVLDAIARREGLTVSVEDVDKEVERFAAESGRTPAALRAQLEKDGGLSRLYTGLRRERAIDLAISRATITNEPQHIGD
jgi:trigger factor